jgi:IS30 family transposase
VYSVVKKSFEVFFVDENALIACWERGLNENTDGLIRQSLLEFNL